MFNFKSLINECDKSNIQRLELFANCHASKSEAEWLDANALAPNANNEMMNFRKFIQIFSIQTKNIHSGCVLFIEQTKC